MSMALLPPQRAAFEVPEDVCYLNCSYMAPQLRSVREAGKAAIDWRSRPWEIVACDFFDDVERVRALFGGLAGAEPDCIALIPAASYGMASAAGALPFEPGGSILLLEGEYPSNFYIWERLARERGGSLVRVERPEDGDWTRAVLARLDKSVRIASLPHCYWVDGGTLDLVRIGAACRAQGAALVLDLTQSWGAMPIDLAAVDPDFAVAAGYKWLLCPYGSSLMYVAPRHHEGRPLEESWAGRAGAENFSQLVPYKDDYQPGARRFDVGERSNFTAVAQMVAALEQIRDWGVERIAERLRMVTGQLAERCAEAGLSRASEQAQAPHIVGFPLPPGTPDDFVERMASEGVYLSRRGDWVRLSPHLHVEEADVDRFGGALARHLPSS
ncbi:MAG TPA: aminotransferase class V-fold PLP-dependent enzyme [Allosphingosinicella sp.]|nr:aminotransferase class V-fold PLP-dependent enzyme [Allosphingosinicella sp.]